MKFYYTYALYCFGNNSLYIGWTDNLVKRVRCHSRGGVKSTKNIRPIKLVYYEACLSKDKSIKREKQLKTGFGRSYLKRRLKI